MPAPPLVDSFGRTHDNLRVSVTDRCNIRCFYCMPEHGVEFVERSEILSYEEIERFVRIAATLGITKVRITGGEPLVRRDLASLVHSVAAIPGIADLALTTNGVLLPGLAEPLFEAGLRRINVHIDTLDRERFQRIARRDELHRVLAGLETARRLGYRVKLNAVAVKNLIEPDVVPLARYARDNGFELRFIEFMPLDAQNLWDLSKVLVADEIIAMLSREIAPLSAHSRSRPARAGFRVRLRGWRRAHWIHRIRQPPVLRQLQPNPADRRRKAAVLPVRTRGRRCEGTAAIRSFGRGNRRNHAAHGEREVGRPRDSLEPVRAASTADVCDRGVGAIVVRRPLFEAGRQPGSRVPGMKWGLSEWLARRR